MNKDSEANPHGIFNALNKSLQNLSEIEPKCYEANLYVLNNDDWIPKHIWIAPRTWYAFLGIHMTVVTISCCILNGIVIAVTLKYEVSACLHKVNLQPKVIVLKQFYCCTSFTKN